MNVVLDLIAVCFFASLRQCSFSFSAILSLSSSIIVSPIVNKNINSTEYFFYPYRAKQFLYLRIHWNYLNRKQITYNVFGYIRISSPFADRNVGATQVSRHRAGGFERARPVVFARRAHVLHGPVKGHRNLPGQSGGTQIQIISTKMNSIISTLLVNCASTPLTYATTRMRKHVSFLIS